MSKNHNVPLTPNMLASNPGVVTTAVVRLTNGDVTVVETANILEITAKVLKKHGYEVRRTKSWLVHDESRFEIIPRVTQVQSHPYGVQTVTTIQLNHPILCPDGVFEYQHSTKGNLRDSFHSGVENWVSMDFRTLLAALEARPTGLTHMEMKFPEAEDQPARIRRAIFGPVMHYQEHSPAETGAPEDQEHPFCPCCLLTQSFEAFQELLESESFYGLRLFAARNTKGQADADCRVNGEDWNPGMDALRDYATRWDQAGYEFRKQYVVLQTVETSGFENMEGEQIAEYDKSGPEEQIL